MGRRLRVVALALAARVAVLVAATLLDAWLPDYDSSSLHPHRTCADSRYSENTKTYAPPEPRSWHKRLVVWDSVFFVQIAKCGYEYEQFHAFFPLLPLLMRGSLQVGEALLHCAQHVLHILQYTCFGRPSKKSSLEKSKASASLPDLAVSLYKQTTSGVQWVLFMSQPTGMRRWL